MKYCSVVEFEYGSGARGSVAMIGKDGATVGSSELETQNANARLFAAAPELLEALKIFQQHVISHACVWDDAANGSHHNPVWAKVVNAIAKAEGRS